MEHGADGGCLGWRARKFVAQPPVVVGEARAALEGILLAQAKGWWEIILEGDCIVQSSLQQFKPVETHAFKCLVLCLKTFYYILVLSMFFLVLLLRRTGNRLAHALAHFPLWVSMF